MGDSTVENGASAAIITGPDEVDGHWLTQALRSSGVLERAEVVAFTSEPIGTGQVGHNLRYQLVYNEPEPDAPTTVVVKFPSPDETSRATGVAVGTYDKEARFYTDLAATVDIRLPRCYYVEHDTEAHLSTLVFEDLAPAEQGDQLIGCSPSVAEQVIDQMSALHAPRWGDPTLDEISWLSRPAPDSGVGVQALYASVWPGFLERFGDRISDDVRRLGALFGDGLVPWASRRAEGPITIVHGDFRLDNLLFGPDVDERQGGSSGGLGAAPAVTTVDWQTVALGIGPDDLAYFLGSGLVTDDRRAHEEALVRRYHDQLRARGVKDYSWDQCWADYRRFSLSGLQMAVVASMIVRGDARGDAMFLAMAERHTAQALDLGADEFLVDSPVVVRPGG